ncbi:MAG: sulfur carrier protein ThiS [Hylemonella sp.]|nr:sulfur carrier protein ThiS [Hylemonella sp.]
MADAIAALDARPPFAAAVNTKFVPKTQYDLQPLHEGDRVEIISPVTGG